ncbi:hypothetical protein HNR31_001483 [Anoxybacillus caldiproteolyticus]|uniref:Uncharacterized protein n=1 Tax=Thermaerobacillus caldiproteolyticus TaxID=247480 RepID=A0A7V9Z614_9BACL|nr:hypothetical protein [Anoxybacillus caldiproteolyticus]
MSIVHWAVKEKYRKRITRWTGYIQRWSSVHNVVDHFHVYHLKVLLADCEIKPMINLICYL